jgi:lipopolysaccharide transport system permease protein
MNRFSISPGAMLFGVWHHRNLIRQLMYREVMGRYSGSFLGVIWSFFTPMLMLAIYTFVFSVVFKARWHGGSDSKTEFAILLFVGMIVFSIFSECINRAPGLIIGNPNYVKKVVFPLEVIPWAVLGSALFHASISLLVLFTFFILTGTSIPITSLTFPAILLPLLLFTLGLSWFLSALAVFIRDVAQTIGIAVTVLMFLSPVFYPLDALPDDFRTIASLNPLALIIESARDVLVWGRLPSLDSYLLNLLASLFVAFLGFAWFQKTRRGFGDVL